jgi:hypothetical protein
MNERRRSTRHMKCLLGRLYFGRNARNSQPCLVLDAFYEGARIIVDNPTSVPDEVELYIPKKNRRAHASVRWRHGERIGLTFSEFARRTHTPLRAGHGNRGA